MKMTRCSGPEVHFFDGEKYNVCPMCGFPAIGKEDNAAKTASSEPEEKKQHKDKKKWPFGGHKKEPGTTGEYEVKLDNPTHAMEYTVTNNEVLTGAKTLTGNGTVAMDDYHNEDESLSHQVRRIHNIRQPEEQQPSFPPQPQAQPQPQVQPPHTQSSQVIPRLMPQQEPVYAPEIPKFNGGSYDDAKTVGVYASAETEPVVGWLVCIKGDECQGESFNLKAGKNMIGRGAGMDVMIPEPTISRERHAILTYEPKKRVFLLQSGDGSGMVYLNDELLMTFSELKARDLIQLGEAVFMFYPFCGEDFTWDDYIGK